MKSSQRNENFERELTIRSHLNCGPWPCAGRREPL